MTDRELLELAAKAAGMGLDYSIRPDGKAFYHSDRNAMALADGGWFAPLTDDGDALRLASRLLIDLRFFPDDGGFVEAWAEPLSDWLREDDLGDFQAATRRAIVRAAAEIGKAMK